MKPEPMRSPGTDDGQGTPSAAQPFDGPSIQTHRAFDALADRMKAGGTREDAIRALTALTGNCVACHAVYRLDEAP